MGDKIINLGIAGHVGSIVTNEKSKVLVLQEWEESERGWGVRPDGYSFHLTEEDANAYIKSYWNDMPKETPSVYSRTSGDFVWVSVTSSFYKEVKKILDKGSSKGYRVWNSAGKVVKSKTGERQWEESHGKV